MNLLESAKQGLKALEEMNPYPASKEQLRAETMRLLRQAIEQAEKQEPVAYIEHHKGGDNLRWEEVNHYYAKATPLYTAPPQREWVGLTDEDIKPLCDEWRIMFGSWAHDFARAIEAKLKEKNAHGWQSVDSPTGRAVDYEYDGSTK